MDEFIEDISRVPLRQGESLYLYSFEHPTNETASYKIYAHSQEEAESEFRRDWKNKFEPKLLRRTAW